MKTQYRGHLIKLFIGNLIGVVIFSSSFILGEDGNLSKYKRYEREYVFVNKLDKDGKIYCDEVKADNVSLNKTAISENLHILPSLNDPNSLRGLKIILRATDQLLQYPEAVLAFRRAAARWERVITTPVTTVLDVDYGPTRFGAAWGAGVLGSTFTADYYAQKSPGVNAVVSDFVQRFKDLKPGNSQLNDLYNAIPIPTPSTVPANLSRGIGALINLQALGFIDAVISSDPNINPFGSVPSIGFNSTFSFDFDPSDGIKAGQSDFDAVCTHEIGHALGFKATAGFSSHTGIEDVYHAWDLFRVRPEAVQPGSLTGFSTAPRVTTAGPPNSVVWATEGGTTYYYSTHVFFDGLSELELSTATSGRLNGDGQQSSHWRDDDQRPPSLGVNRWIGIMDPTLAAGVREEINTNDLRMLEVIGYGIDFNFKYASVRVRSGSDTLDLDGRTDTLKFGNVDIGGQKQIQLEFDNMSLDNPLIYELEYFIDNAQPSDAAITLSGTGSTVLVGQSQLTTITASNPNKAGAFFGTLRIHTNDENKLVIDIPFEVNAGGALPPTINSSPNTLGDFLFATQDDIGQKSKSLTLSNLGNLPLQYRIYTSLSTKNGFPSSLLKSNSKQSNLAKFFGDKAFSANIIYSNNFEGGFGGFTQVSTAPHGWQRTAVGPASLTGHSTPTAVHFGKEVNGQPVYDSLVTGTLYSPKFDFSQVPPQDVVSITFNYFNKSEVGYDFVYVLLSLDNGKTWSVLTSSNNGLLKEQSTEWETVLLQFPDLSGNPDSVQFAFQFNSDELIVDQGFYLDDFEIATIPDLNSVFTSVRAGELPNLNSSQQLDVTVNGAVLSPGYYNGAISVISNDFKTSSLAIPFTVSYVLLNKAVSGTLYASTGRGLGSTGRVIKLDKQTGAGTDIGLSGFSPLRSITLNPNTNELFGFNNVLGAPTYIVKIDGLSGFGLFQAESPVLLSAVAFDPAGNLLAIATTQKIYQFDLATGDTTYITTSKIKAAAFAVEPATGDYFVSIDASTNKDRIYKVDKSTGDTVLFSRIGIGNNTIRSMAFDNQGELWGTYGEENSISTLFKVDKATGLASVIGSTNFRGVLGLTFTPDSTTLVNSEKINENSFILLNNYPNPFNPSTNIEFTLPVVSRIKVKVYNLLGQTVKTIFEGTKEAGYQKLIWNAQDQYGNSVSTGIYFYELSAVGIDGREFSQMKKMVLLK